MLEYIDALPVARFVGILFLIAAVAIGILARMAARSPIDPDGRPKLLNGKPAPTRRIH
jgi:hypothetical protein